MNVSPQTLVFGFIIAFHALVIGGGTILHRRGMKKKAEEQSQTQN